VQVDGEGLQTPGLANQRNKLVAVCPRRPCCLVAFNEVLNVSRWCRVGTRWVRLRRYLVLSRHLDVRTGDPVGGALNFGGLVGQRITIAFAHLKSESQSCRSLNKLL
jgi:hypothetical protein